VLEECRSPGYPWHRRWKGLRRERGLRLAKLPPSIPEGVTPAIGPVRQSRRHGRDCSLVAALVVCRPPGSGRCKIGRSVRGPPQVEETATNGKMVLFVLVVNTVVAISVASSFAMKDDMATTAPKR